MRRRRSVPKHLLGNRSCTSIVCYCFLQSHTALDGAQESASIACRSRAATGAADGGGREAVGGGGGAEGAGGGGAGELGRDIGAEVLAAAD